MFIEYKDGKKITVNSLKESFQLIRKRLTVGNYIGIAVICWFFFGWLYGYERALHYSFNGIIEKVEYDEPKHIPTITINGSEYNLVYNTWDEGKKSDIEKGDSAIKKKDTTGFILIRHKPN